MPTERQVQELMARCIDIASRRGEAECDASLCGVADEVSGMGLTAEGADRLLLVPLLGELIARHGVDRGASLGASFRAAFEEAVAVRDPDHGGAEAAGQLADELAARSHSSFDAAKEPMLRGDG